MALIRAMVENAIMLGSEQCHISGCDGARLGRNRAVMRADKQPKNR